MRFIESSLDRMSALLEVRARSIPDISGKVGLKALSDRKSPAHGDGGIDDCLVRGPPDRRFSAPVSGMGKTAWAAGGVEPCRGRARCPVLHFPEVQAE